MKPFALILTFVLLLPSAAVLAQTSYTESGYIGGEIFGKKSRWLHAYLSLSEVYSDNIYNSAVEEESDLITIVNPGIQMTIPGTRQRAEDIATDPVTPGGLMFGRFTQNSFQRFKAYAGYAPMMQFYADNKDENVVNHYGQAGMQLNLKGGLFLDAADRFDKNYDQRKTDVSPRTDSYYSNLFNLVAGLPLTEKFILRLDYSNFQVKYTDEEKNGYLDRRDNSGSGSIFFRIMPKTSVYLKYRYTDLNYENVLDRNANEQDFLAGLKWDFTTKTNLNIQAGYGIRSYETASYEDNENFVCQVNLKYQLSPKTRLMLDAYRRNEESSESIYDFTKTTAANFRYIQILSPKVDVELKASYRRYDYIASKAESAGAPDRIDNYSSFTPTFSYNFQPWLSASLAYSFRKRDSDQDADAFTGNLVMFKITGSL